MSKWAVRIIVPLAFILMLPFLFLWALFQTHIGWTRLNPVYWWGNDEDGWYGTDKWVNLNGGKNNFRVAYDWAMRNPLHNFTHHVIGYHKSNYTLHFASESGDWWPLPGKWFQKSYVHIEELSKAMPFISFAFYGIKRRGYMGWRPTGAFGLAFRKIDSENM